MTNYNERLDGVLNQLVSKTADASYGEWQVVGLPEAKQAITSLMKELVAEAKPTNFRNSAMTTDETNWYSAGYNHALENFEQNLLKALEERDDE